jgi:hypothetical protein
MIRISGAGDYKLELSTEEKPERVPCTTSIKEYRIDHFAIRQPRFLNLRAPR